MVHIGTDTINQVAERGAYLSAGWLTSLRLHLRA